MKVERKENGESIYFLPTFLNIKIYVHRQTYRGKVVFARDISKAFRISVLEVVSICNSEKGFVLNGNKRSASNRQVDIDYSFIEQDEPSELIFNDFNKLPPHEDIYEVMSIRTEER